MPTVHLGNRVVARVAYDESVRALEDQERELEQLRTRTGVMLATAAVAASFLAPSLHHTHDWLSILAAIAFVTAVSASLYVLAPKTKLVFTLNATSLYNALAGLDDRGEVYRRVADWQEGFWQTNRVKLESVTRWGTVAGIALFVEIVAGVLAIRFP